MPWSGMYCVYTYIYVCVSIFVNVSLQPQQPLFRLRNRRPDPPTAFLPRKQTLKAPVVNSVEVIGLWLSFPNYLARSWPSIISVPELESLCLFYATYGKEPGDLVPPCIHVACPPARWTAARCFCAQEDLRRAAFYNGLKSKVGLAAAKSRRYGSISTSFLSELSRTA